VKQEREFLARKLLELEPSATELLQPYETRPYKKRSSSDTINSGDKPLKKKERVQQSLLKKQTVTQQITIPKVPVVVDGITVLCFGRIIQSPAFFSDFCIYPASYKISRLFMNKMFVCQIKLDSQSPIFEISLASDPQNFTFSGQTTDDVHAEVLHVFNNNVGLMVDGDAFFGLKNKRIRDFIQMLPNAKRLIKIKQEKRDEMIVYDENARNYM
jgi:hypothetical protein